MKKEILFLFFLLALATLVGCRARQQAATATAQAVSDGAQPPVAEGVVLFQDDFQDGQPDDWNITSAWAVQQDGDTYTFNSAGQGGAWVPGGGNWGDYEYETAARVTSGGVVLSYRVSPQGRYMLHFNGDGLYLTKEYPKNTFTTLTQVAAPTFNDWHQLSVAGYGGHLQVYVDRVLQLDYTDPMPLLQGTIGVGTLDGAQAAIDDVLVTRLTAALPTPVPAALPATVVPSNSPPEDAGLSLEEVPADDGNISPAGEEPSVEDAPAPSEEDVPPPAGLPVIDYFYAEASEREDCHYLYWDLHDANTAAINGQGVVAPGSEEVCIEETTTFTLLVENDAGQVEESITITVGGGDAPAMGQPDLVLGDILIWNTMPENPGAVEISIPVNNIGNASTGAFTVRWYPHGNSDEVGCSIDLDGLPANASQIINCAYTYAGHGDMHWRAIVDADNDIQNEVFEDNNELRGTMFIEAAGQEQDQPEDEVDEDAPEGEGMLPDLVPRDLLVLPDSILQPEQTFSVRFRVSNMGSVPAVPSTAHWNMSGTDLACNCEVPEIGAGGSFECLCSTLVAPINAGNYGSRAVVDHLGVVSEAEEENNRLNQTIEIRP